MAGALTLPIGRHALAPPAEAPAADDSVERRIGWMVAVGSVLLFAATLPAVSAQRHAFAAWWALPAAAAMAVVVVAAALDPVLPSSMLRGLWRVLPPVALALGATWTLARTEPGAAAGTGPWAWGLEPTAVAFAALVWPAPAAVAYSQVSAVTVVAAAAAADGTVSRALAVTGLAHLGGVVFVALVVGIRRQLVAVQLSERLAADSVAQLARARAEEAEHARLATIVHDEVLATLTPAVWAPSSPSLVAQARRARLALRGGSRDEASEDGVARAAFAAAVRERVAPLGPAVAVCVWAGGDPLPGPVAEALLAATDEAVRNSLAHAAGRPPRFGVTRLVEVSADDRGVQVAVRDDGVGFDPARVDPRRLGLRQSILERVHALPGGHARVDSSPGAGTTVTVGWRAT